MPYIQKINLSNGKDILFSLTDEEFESFKNFPFEREYKHDETRLYYDISKKEEDFEYISDSIYNLIKNTSNIVTLIDYNVDIKSKKERRYEYVTERTMTHGDADFDTNEVFIIDEETFDIMEENGATVTFEVYDKTSNYSFSEEFVFDCDDFKKCDRRFSIFGNTDFKLNFNIDSFINDFLESNEENEKKKKYIGPCFSFAFDYKNETDMYNFFINKYQFEFYDYFAKVCNYCFKNNDYPSEREFNINYPLSLLSTDDFGKETYYLDFDAKKSHDEYEDEDTSHCSKEIYDKYCKHTIENVLPNVKKDFPYYYKKFRLEETIPAFLRSITINQFYD